jgi:hypothetical protein
MQWLVGALCIGGGLFLLVVRKPLARDAIEGQRATWGFDYGRRHIAGAELFFILLGTSLIIVGLLTLLGLVDAGG